MALGKQAKPLTKAQVEAVLGYLARTRYPIRNRLIFLLSIRAGLRAREIALLTWSMVTDAEGNVGHMIALQNEVSKGRSGRVIRFILSFGQPSSSATEYTSGFQIRASSVPNVKTNIASGHREHVFPIVRTDRL